VFDSTWEASEAYELDHSEHVAAWVKNDHLGFEILYTFDGIVRNTGPTFSCGCQRKFAASWRIKQPEPVSHGPFDDSLHSSRQHRWQPG
jgi:hypothetical protein